MVYLCFIANAVDANDNGQNVEEENGHEQPAELNANGSNGKFDFFYIVINYECDERVT